MGNVTALPGFVVPTADPDQEVVDLLQKMLDKAVSGRLRGVAIVGVERDPDAYEVVYHSGSNRHTLAAGVMCLHWKISQRMAE